MRYLQTQMPNPACSVEYTNYPDIAKAYPAISAQVLRGGRVYVVEGENLDDLSPSYLDEVTHDFIPDYLTVPEYARMVGRDTSVILRRIYCGKLKAEKQGNQWVVQVDPWAAEEELQTANKTKSMRNVQRLSRLS
jgi:hypothetical protein